MTFPSTPPMRYTHHVRVRAARDGNGLHKWLDEDMLTGNFVVSTNAAIYYDIPDGMQVMVDELMVGVDSVNKTIAAYVVGCAAVAGGGAATQFMHHLHLTTGAAKDGDFHITDRYHIPICIRYSDGYRSVSLAVKANAAQVDGSYGWCGWVERETT